MRAERSGGHAATGEIRALTGLRGVAAAVVVLYHMLQDAPGDGMVVTALHHGYLAVDQFFVLSGFVLAMVHGHDCFDRAGYAAFLRKRLARIYPLYIAVTLATLVLLIVDGVAISPGRLAVNALLLQGWGFGTSIVAPSWSLSAEFAAYLLFPILAGLLLKGPRTQAVAGAALAFAVLAAVSLGGPQPRSGPLDLYQSNTLAPLLRCLGGFALGLAAYRLWQADIRLLGTRWASAVLGLGMAGLLACRNSDLLVVVLMVPFTAALARGRGSIAGRVLASAPLHRLGVLSFSIYLVHYPVRDWLRTPLAGWLAAVGVPHAEASATLAACAVTLGVATVTYRLIERPARSMVRAHLRLAPTLP